MKLPDLKVIGRTEWIGMSILLVGGTLIYVFLIHPSVQSFAALNDAQNARESAVQDLVEVRRQQQALLSKIVQQRHQLDSLGGSPPSLRDKENQIARITTIAHDCQVTIDQIAPMGDIDTPDYSAVYISFTGRGSFPSIREFFRRVETDIDYVDVTHFTLTSSPVSPTTGAEPPCVLTLSCKLSGMPRPAGESDTPEKPHPAEPVEVVYHEP